MYVCSPRWCVSQQHFDVSVLEFHLERTPLLTSPHPPELTGQSVPPLDFTSSVLSVCYTLASLALKPRRSLVSMFVFVGPLKIRPLTVMMKVDVKSSSSDPADTPLTSCYCLHWAPSHSQKCPGVTAVGRGPFIVCRDVFSHQQV